MSSTNSTDTVSGPTIWSEPSLTDWISAGAATVSTIVVILALFYAKRQINVWRTEARQRRRAEVAEDVLAAAHSAADAIRSMRSPMDRVPIEEANNKTYIYEQRWKRMVERGSVFETLRHAQIRAKSVLQDEETDVAVEKVFKVRGDFMIALEMAVEYARDHMDLTPEDRDHLRTYRTRIYGRFDEKDELHVELTGALAILENALGPVIRLEGARPKDRAA